jgi:hypothetical protein
MTMNESYKDIPGWGADLDRANRPAVPMERTPPRLEGVHWEQVPPQPQRVEILKSTEHFTMPPVFGTSAPPHGVSGWMRRCAFHHSENDLRHWLMLMAADRVDVVESAVCDAAKSRKVQTGALVVGGLLVAGYLLRPRRRRW